MILTILNVTDGGWVGLYTDGKLFVQADHLNWESILEESGLYTVVHIERPVDWLVKQGGKLPPTLAPVNNEIEEKRTELIQKAKELDQQLAEYTQDVINQKAQIEDALKGLG